MSSGAAAYFKLECDELIDALDSGHMRKLPVKRNFQYHSAAARKSIEPGEILVIDLQGCIKKAAKKKAAPRRASGKRAAPKRKVAPSKVSGKKRKAARPTSGRRQSARIAEQKRRRK